MRLLITIVINILQAMADIDYLFGRCNNSKNGRWICTMFVAPIVLGQDESNLCRNPGCGHARTHHELFGYRQDGRIVPIPTCQPATPSVPSSVQKTATCSFHCRTVERYQAEYYGDFQLHELSRPIEKWTLAHTMIGPRTFTRIMWVCCSLLNWGGNWWRCWLTCWNWNNTTILSVTK